MTYIIYTIVLLDVLFFFFNDTATTEIYTLSLHDALPIFRASNRGHHRPRVDWPVGTGSYRIRAWVCRRPLLRRGVEDRKSTRLNSSHANISYAVFCLKKKKIMFTTQYKSLHYLSYTIVMS